MRTLAHNTAPYAGRAAPLGAVAAEAAALAVLAPAVVALAASADAGAWADAWATSRGWLALGHTLHLAALAATMAVVPAAILAAGAARLPRAWRSAAMWAACLPMLVPASLAATAWMGVLGGAAAGGSITAAAAVMAMRTFGLAALVLVPTAARRRADVALARAAGASRGAAWLHAGARPAAGPVAAAWLLAALVAMNDHITPGLLLVSTYGTQVLIQYQAMLDPAGAAALAAPVAALGVAAAAAALRAGRRTWRDPDAPSALPAAGPSRGEAVAGGAIVAAVLAMALAVPVGALVRQAGSWAMLAQAFDSARPQAWQTLRVAGATAAVCAALAPLLAGRWLAAWRRGRASLVPLVLVNLAVPPSLIGIGLVRMTTWPGLAPLADSAAPLVAAQVARFLPVVTLLYLARERRRSVEPLAAARAHGLGALATLVHVWWPSHRATVAAAGLLGGVLAATELETSVLLAPPGGATLGVRLYALIHTVPQALTAALALDILLAAAPAIALLGVLAARGQREETA